MEKGFASDGVRKMVWRVMVRGNVLASKCVRKMFFLASGRIRKMVWRVESGVRKIVGEPWCV